MVVDKERTNNMTQTEWWSIVGKAITAIVIVNAIVEALGIL